MPRRGSRRSTSPACARCSGSATPATCSPAVPIDPTTASRDVAPAGVDAARRFLARRFPALADAPLVASEVCQYESTPDSHFIVDRLPGAANVWIAGGGSGHGFKMGPAIG